MNTPTTIIRIPVDPANPGQFFACCGLLELADRLWEGTEGWFEECRFCFKTEDGASSLKHLLENARSIGISENSQNENDHDNHEENTETDVEIDSITITSPISLTLDWWRDKSLKPWAGSMDARKIFIAMCAAIESENIDPLNQLQVVFDPIVKAASNGEKKRPKKPKKREPFYFDGRRGASALPIDIGFSPDSLKVKTIAYPVVEAMALIGLQRCRPKPTETSRIFEYFIWNTPLSISVLPLAVYGLIGNGTGYRFENAFRTSQRKHKAFNPATPQKRS